MDQRIVFFGISDILKPAIEWLNGEQLPYIIITNEEQAKKVDFPITKTNIKIVPSLSHLQIDNWNGSDLGISVGAPWFFSDNFIKSFPPGRLLNLHGSQLPLYRGGNLFSWFVLNKIHTGMCLIHNITSAFDSGKLISYKEFIYPQSCRRPIDYIKVYNLENGRFLLDFLKRFLSNQQSLAGSAQPEYLSTYWPRLKADVNGWINWDLSGDNIERFILAFDEPYSGAQTTWRAKVILIKDVYFQPGMQHHPFQNGIVTRNNSRWLTVAVQGGDLLICHVTDVNGNPLLDKILSGDRLVTQMRHLESAKRRVLKKGNDLSVQPDFE